MGRLNCTKDTATVHTPRGVIRASAGDDVSPENGRSGLYKRLCLARTENRPWTLSKCKARPDAVAATARAAPRRSIVACQAPDSGQGPRYATMPLFSPFR